MVVKRLEAIADAVAHLNGYHDPESELYELRNPGGLKGPDGKRRYSCHRAGYASFTVGEGRAYTIEQRRDHEA